MASRTKNAFTERKLPLGQYLSVMAKQYFASLSKYMEDIDPGRYFTVLLYLHSEKKGVPQQQISENLHIDKVYVVKILDYLEQHQFVERVVNAGDRREKQVMLTATGIKNIEKIRKKVKAFEKIAFQGFTTEEIQQFYTQLQQINDNFENLPKNPMRIKIQHGD